MTDAILAPTTHIIKPLMRDIAQDVANKHRMTLADLKRHSRQRPIAWARFEAMWRIRNELHKPRQQIATFFGLKDHSSVIHAERRWQHMLDGG